MGGDGSEGAAAACRQSVGDRLGLACCACWDAVVSAHADAMLACARVRALSRVLASVCMAVGAAGLALLMVALEGGAGRRRSALATGARRVSVLCVAGFWSLQLSQQLEAVSWCVRLGLPRLVYLLAGAELFCLVTVPALEHLFASSSFKYRLFAPETAFLHHLFAASLGWRGDGEGEQGAVPEPLSCTVECMVPVAALVFGADSTPILVIFLFCALCCICFLGRPPVWDVCCA